MRERGHPQPEIPKKWFDTIDRKNGITVFIPRKYTYSGTPRDRDAVIELSDQAAFPQTYPNHTVFFVGTDIIGVVPNNDPLNADHRIAVKDLGVQLQQLGTTAWE